MTYDATIGMIIVYYSPLISDEDAMQWMTKLIDRMKLWNVR